MIFFYVLANITGFRKSRRVGHCKRHIEDPCQRLRQQRLAASRRPHEQDIGLSQLNVIVLCCVVEPLVMIMHRHGQHALGVVLTNHVGIEHILDL